MISLMMGREANGERRLQEGERGNFFVEFPRVLLVIIMAKIKVTMIV